ncbi:hypothetical protein F5882DRAFT_478807 [Hyaloscypha sp. PMI_1271]|nr:hypothetical protein F5882DRAFT_478807 [Hyaloscypha sp. PMI_1271]
MADLSQSELIKAKPAEGLASRELQITENVQYYLDKHNLIGVGVFTHVHRVDGGRVRKVPAPDSNDLDLAIKSIQREGGIYVYLGDHPRVIKCLTKGDLFIDLEYAPYRHIESYLRSHHDTSDKCRIRFSDGDVLGFENSSHQLPRDLDGDMPSTVQSDLFALGSTLYEVITRRRPYEGLPDSPNHRSLAGGGRHRGPIENHVTYQGRPFKVSV